MPARTETDSAVPAGRWHDPIVSLFYRVAASGWVSPRFFLHAAPDPRKLPGRTGRLTVEIVSHCWQYAPMLAYQLSSLVRYPPRELTVRMTVFYSPEDAATSALLDFFGRQTVP